MISSQLKSMEVVMKVYNVGVVSKEIALLYLKCIFAFNFD